MHSAAGYGIINIIQPRDFFCLVAVYKNMINFADDKICMKNE